MAETKDPVFISLNQHYYIKRLSIDKSKILIEEVIVLEIAG